MQQLLRRRIAATAPSHGGCLLPQTRHQRSERQRACLPGRPALPGCWHQSRARDRQQPLPLLTARAQAAPACQLPDLGAVAPVCIHLAWFSLLMGVASRPAAGGRGRWDAVVKPPCLPGRRSALSMPREHRRGALTPRVGWCPRAAAPVCAAFVARQRGGGADAELVVRDWPALVTCVLGDLCLS